MLRHDWTVSELEALFELPFNDLLFKAQTIHRNNFDPNKIQLSTLLSIKTGGCPEDCQYCPQSVHYDTGVDAHPLLSKDEVCAAARRARDAGATRFCMGAAWRQPSDRQIDQVAELIAAVRDEGMDTCVTLGMLTPGQAQSLAAAGLDYYNHNLDTDPDLYQKIISTRVYQERLDTLENVRSAGMHVCCGGIVGLGEDRRGRAKLLVELASLPRHPESVPINMLVQVKGTPLYGTPKLDVFEFIRTIAVARIVMPRSFVRLSAGRSDMTREAQALCFFAGANSIFSGEQLLTTPNPDVDEDRQYLQQLGINTYESVAEVRSEREVLP